MSDNEFELSTRDKPNKSIDQEGAIKSFLKKATIKEQQIKRSKTSKSKKKIPNDHHKKKSMTPKDKRSESSRSRVKKATRHDKYGSPIKKGGRQRIVFRDNIKDENNKQESLCDVVDISLMNKQALSKKNSLVKKNSLGSNNDKPEEKPSNKSSGFNISSLKSNDKSNTSKNSKDENCSCACIIF